MYAHGLDDTLVAEALADAALNDENLADVWDSWSSHWEREFSRLNGLEEQWKKQGAERIQREVTREVQYAHLEEAAKMARETEEEMEEMRREKARQQLKDDAAQARKQSMASAMESSDDIVRQISEKNAQRRKENEARRKKELDALKEAQQKRRDAKYDTPKQPPPRASADAPSAPGMPRHAPRRPRSSSLSKEGGPPSARPPPARFNSFPEFDAYWNRFEQRVHSGGRDLHFTDVPWPISLVTVSGVHSGESLQERKKKLRAALVRWHPDKWSKLLDAIHECDRAKVVEKVKEVTRRIIEEKKRYST
jgi:hypothetical protein